MAGQQRVLEVEPAGLELRDLELQPLTVHLDLTELLAQQPEQEPQVVEQLPEADQELTEEVALEQPQEAALDQEAAVMVQEAVQGQQLVAALARQLEADLDQVQVQAEVDLVQCLEVDQEHPEAVLEHQEVVLEQTELAALGQLQEADQEHLEADQELQEAVLELQEAELLLVEDNKSMKTKIPQMRDFFLFYKDLLKLLSS